MIVSVHQPQYIPWLGYFDKIIKSDCFVFLDQVQYKPREFQNRNKIRTQNGWMWLTVPVISGGLRYQRICDVKIDCGSDWQRRHWKSIQSAYGKARHFHEYAQFFEKIYSLEWKTLVELNSAIIRYMLDAFSIKTAIYYESEIGTSSQSTDRIIEICRKLNANTYLSGVGGKAYLKEEKFLSAGIQLLYQDFVHPVYSQHNALKQDAFLPFMSSLDLLFSEGGGSLGTLLRKETG
jgi:hypothetical protein